MEAQAPTCKVCGKTPEEHQFTAHTFQADHDRLEAKPKPDEGKVARPMTTSDPILRYLLIQKGILTAEELGEAERTLAATGLLVTKEPDAGQR